ncbi:MAG: hypothetical protein IT305_13330 [Chloroflexi bacterium]|nr:hypothetical protein [Chloroflexota bacterium]
MGIATGLRAAAQGVSFLPIAGFQGSDLVAALGLKTVRDPYTDQEFVAVPRLQPDWAIVHVPEADMSGNARIYGSPFWDRLMARAARRTIVTAERIVPREELARQPERTTVPEVLVAAVVEAPSGAWPGSCYPLYQVDYPAVERYLSALDDDTAFAAYLADEPGLAARRADLATTARLADEAAASERRLSAPPAVEDETNQPGPATLVRTLGDAARG